MTPEDARRILDGQAETLHAEACILERLAHENPGDAPGLLLVADAHRRAAAAYQAQEPASHRETLAEIARLVATLPPGPPRAYLHLGGDNPEAVDGLTQLGGKVSLSFAAYGWHRTTVLVEFVIDGIRVLAAHERAATDEERVSRPKC